MGFFGEGLPHRFFEHRHADLQNCDLVIVMGTSLVVAPFNRLLNLVPATTPRLLLNFETAGLSDNLEGGFRFHRENNWRDVFHQGDCNSSVSQLAEKLGWAPDLTSLIESRGAAEISKAP